MRLRLPDPPVAANPMRHFHLMAVDPPRPRMPPLNALRAFEAAARHESFAKAAEELGVTPAAIALLLVHLKRGVAPSAPATRRRSA